MSRCLEFVGIIVEDREKHAESVNKIFSEFGEIIVVRTGIPVQAKKCGAIMLIIEATTEKIASFINKIKSIKGVTVKSMTMNI